MRTYRRISGKLDEEICAENNRNLFDYHIPVADHSDFRIPGAGREDFY